MRLPHLSIYFLENTSLKTPYYQSSNSPVVPNRGSLESRIRSLSEPAGLNAVVLGFGEIQSRLDIKTRRCRSGDRYSDLFGVAEFNVLLIIYAGVSGSDVDDYLLLLRPVVFIIFISAPIDFPPPSPFLSLLSFLYILRPLHCFSP